jgi:hypothetical protein
MEWSSCKAQGQLYLLPYKVWLRNHLQDQDVDRRVILNRKYGWLVGWLVGWLAGWLAVWLAG